MFGKIFKDPVSLVTGGLADKDQLAQFIPGVGDAMAQDKANETNRKENIANRDWMEKMSNSAYQRAMDDMKKAGLNPMLAYQQGGASVPTNNAPVAEASSKTKLADAALGAFTGISAARSQAQQANTAQAQAESTVALQATQATQNAAQSVKTQAETEKVKEQIKSERVRRQLDQKSVPLASVTESAASLAQKGVSTIDKVTDKLLKNSAKPSIDEKSLNYKNPLIPEFIHKGKKANEESRFKWIKDSFK